MPEPDTRARAQAKACFDRGRRAAEAGDFDGAIDAYLDGLRLAPDDISEGHIELRVVALQRQEQGGTTPPPEEVDRRQATDGTPLDRMLNAEYLLATDPEHLPHGEALLRAAVEGGFREAAKWIADLMFLANNNARKPSASLYVLLRDSYEAIRQYARAAAACQRAMRLRPGDQALRSDLKRLRAKLAPRARSTRSAGPGKAVPQRARVRPDNHEPGEAIDPAQAEAATTEEAAQQNLSEAKTFFDKARKAAEKQQYDYAIGMYLDGLARAPEALEEGHLPLCELGLQRRGRGGKKPSMMEKVKRMRGKTPLEQMLNAEYLFAKDPDNLAYAEAMLKAAVEGGYKRTGHWIANLIFQTNNAVEKPSLQTYLLLKDSYSSLGKYDKAVAACQRAVRMRPDNKDLADEFKNLSAELTMSRGKYNVEGDFRQSIKDSEAQARMYAQDRVVKPEDYRAAAVEEARKAYAREPDLPKSTFNLAQALADLQTDEAENEAVQLLDDAYLSRDDFSFKERAGALRIRQLRRKIRQAKNELEVGTQNSQAKATLSELTAALQAIELEHYRLCVENYPTDLGHKYEYALRLMRNKRYNEAIPLFQEAQKDPRRKIAAMDKIGYCFFLKGWYTDAIDVFTTAIGSYEIKDDATAKELRYNLARAHEEQGEKARALEIYRKIAQMDFGYRDVSDRVDRLRAATDQAATSQD